MDPGIIEAPVARLIPDNADPAVVLRARHRVGRSRGADLHLSELSVSGEHAVLTWDGSTWTVRDLGSTNGTWLDGRRLPTGEAVPLEVGAALRFGTGGATWRLADAEAPGPMAMAPDGAAIYGLGDLLLLPDPERPQVSVHLDEGGRWVREESGQLAPASDGELVAVGAATFRLHLPEALERTWRETSPGPALSELWLRFTVSRDEEHVELEGRCGDRVIPLHARAYHYMLLTLARARLADANTQASGDQGWLDAERLCRMLGVDERTLNTWVYRTRRLFAEAGIPDAAGVIARRPGTRQLRIGTDRLVVTRDGA